MFLNIFWSTGITHKQLFHWLIKSIQAIPFFLFSTAGNGFEKKKPQKITSRSLGIGGPGTPE